MNANDVALYWAMAAFSGSDPSEAVLAMLERAGLIELIDGVRVPKDGFAQKFQDLNIIWKGQFAPPPPRRGLSR